MYLVLNTIAVSIGAIRVHWYGIILGTAALVGLFIAIQEGKLYKIHQDFFMDMLLITVPAAINGARAYYVVIKERLVLLMFVMWTLLFQVKQWRLRLL